MRTAKALARRRECWSPVRFFFKNANDIFGNTTLMIGLCFKFSLIAAYLDPRDEEEWVRLADMSLEHNDPNQAIKCYSNGRSADNFVKFRTPKKKKHPKFICSSPLKQREVTNFHLQNWLLPSQNFWYFPFRN